MKPIFILIIVFETLAFIGHVRAQSIEKQPDGSATWQAGIDGATLDFNPDGTVRRIYSKYSQPVTITDKRGIQTAMIIAEEKAKANIVRFLNQQVASNRIVSEFENTASKTIQETNGTGNSVSSTEQRSISQGLTELTSSFSSGTLNGVVVLENGYDEKEREAWVVVGLSQKTMAAARATQDMLSESQKPIQNGLHDTSKSIGDSPKSSVRHGNLDF
jgi:hypothetical protein